LGGGRDGVEQTKISKFKTQITKFPLSKEKLTSTVRDFSCHT